MPPGLNHRRDPVDLILEGDLAGATEMYSELYIRSLTEGDRYIGSDLCTQLLYSVAAEHGLPADQAIPRVRELLLNKVRCADLPVNGELQQHLDDDLQVAVVAIGRARKRAERSIQAVEVQSVEGPEN